MKKRKLPKEKEATDNVQHMIRSTGRLIKFDRQQGERRRSETGLTFGLEKFMKNAARIQTETVMMRVLHTSDCCHHRLFFSLVNSKISNFTRFLFKTVHDGS